MKANRTQFLDNFTKNEGSYVQYFRRLEELSISMFEWKGLPDSIDPRYLELTLLYKGESVFFKDEVMDEYLALPNAQSGPFDTQMNPTLRMAYANNGYNKELTDKDSVIIWNNMLRTNSVLDIRMYAERLYEMDRVIDVNIKAQKTPVLIRCNNNQLFSMQQVYQKFDGNSPVIFADKNLDPNSIEVLTTGAPFVADKIYELKTQLWNEALTYLGISNINVVKKERMITDEVTRNSGGIIASRYSRLTERQRACERINKMFGLHVSCEYRNDNEDLIPDDEVTTSDKGESDNE